MDSLLVLMNTNRLCDIFFAHFVRHLNHTLLSIRQYLSYLHKVLINMELIDIFFITVSLSY